MSEERSKIMDDLIAQDADLIDIEPVAYRYGFDGYGWQYIDNGSGSDWVIRHPDGEPLYAHPPAARIEALSAENERLTINGIHTCHDECQRVPCMQRREIKHLKDILEIWITNYQRLNGLKHDDALAYAKAWMFRNANGEEPE